ncbi:heme o synthase [Turneriella parva]|uniref:Protoheme IX farnesyltransferase n=1 Tax=Turneriella parva (strain ATCC BAA-1111 / DSM 21527 / NCTC 11395 / H) TaxID=869212 RepID=I4B4Y9_TURPD|nr:heme o synthase [Turneriella parva]AFM12346.1 Protoheme IX farnesyltransferase [Turneriella parva DSM 21527]
MRDIIRLAKGSIIFTVVVTGFTGMLMARRSVPTLWETLWVLISLTLSSGSSAIMNNLLDYEMDKHMRRTEWRSKVIDRFGKRNLWVLALLMSALSFVPLIHYGRLYAAVFTALAIASYAIWYTLYLKRRGPFGAIVGGLPGALPVLIGAYAISDRFAPDIWLLFAFMMLWQPAHFWALTLKIQGEYEKGGVPVLPLVYGNEYTQLYILIYGLSLPPLALAIGLVAGYGWVYLIGSGIASIYYVIRTVRGIYRQEQYGRAFFASIIYMLVIMVLLNIDIFLHLPMNAFMGK